MSLNRKEFSWLHFSDLHFNFKENFNTILAKEQLIEFLKDHQENLKCDYVFFSGDIANRGEYSNAKSYIHKLIDNIKFKTDLPNKYDNVFWAVGNHDIKRGKKIRESIIREIRDSKDNDKFQGKMFNEEERQILVNSGMSEYIKEYNNIFGKNLSVDEITNAHVFKELPEFNLIVLNTCLASFDDNDRYQLRVYEQKIHSIFEKINKNKPTFVLGHHGREFFHPDEQEKISRLFDNKVDFYLCGHSHRLGYANFSDTMTNELHQLICGGGVWNGYSKFSFMHGTYNLETHEATITPYGYFETGTQQWNKDYNLHLKLCENNCLEVSRLKKNMGNFKQSFSSSHIIDKLFAKSNNYYQMLTDKHGRFAYIKFDETLFTKAKPSFDTKVQGENNIHSVTDWEKLNKNSVLIGEGGMGKTMSLLKIWQELLEDYKKSKTTKPTLPFYVPLNEFNISDSNNFIADFIRRNYKIDLEDLNSFNITVLLLLDGFNEITKQNTPIVHEIKKWGAQNNVKIILTSRYNFISIYSFQEFEAKELLPLEDSVIKDFLKVYNLPFDSQLYNILKNPMMLTLYANICLIKEHEDIKNLKIFPFKGTETKGELLYDYLLCQLANLKLTNEQTEIIPAVVALFFIAPYIAYKTERDGQIFVEKSQLIPLIKECLEVHRKEILNEIDKQFSGLLSKLRLTDTLAINSINKYQDLLEYKYHIFIEEDNKYVFRHQYFRDFFSALHIINILNDNYTSMKKPFPPPMEIKDYVITDNVCLMIGDCLGEHKNTINSVNKTVLHDLTYSLKNKKQPEFKYALVNIINILKISRNNQILNEDLSYLDFSRVLLNGITFSNGFCREKNLLATSFYGSTFMNNSLMPLGHSHSVNSATYSPDGKWIVSASVDNTIKIWDSTTGEMVKTLQGHSSRITSAAYSSDGKRIVSASWDNTIKIWDSATGEVVKTLQGHSDSVDSAAYSPDGKRIVSASWDNTIKIWDSATGEVVKTLQGHSGSVDSAAYSPDGKRIIFVSDGNTIKIRDSATGKMVKTLQTLLLCQFVPCFVPYCTQMHTNKNKKPP